MRAFLIGAILALFVIPAAWCADSGGVSESTQVWEGVKIFLADTPVSTTATGNITLYNDSKNIQIIDPGGSARNVTLPNPPDGQNGRRFKIVNAADAAEALTVKNAAASTIATVNQYQTGDFFWSGSAWVASVYTSSASGFVAADGTTVGATAQAQDFGAFGIKTDNIISSTGTTTNFNIKLTDNLADALNIKEATNSYLKFVTTNSAEKIQLGVDLDCPAARNVTVLDNSATALVFEEGSNAYLTLVTTNSSEAVKVSKKLNVAAPLMSTPATVQDVTTGGTITLPAASFTQRLTASGGAATGMILTAGSYDGQIVTLINADTTNDITFAASGTSHVADGTSSAVTAKTAMTLIYDNTTSLWYHVK